MKQFDLVANPSPRSRERQPYLAVLQTDLLLRHFDTTIVAPLEPAQPGRLVDRLNPTMEIDGRNFVLIMQELVSIRKSVLGPTRGSVAHQREAILRALDLLFTGF